MSNRSKTLYAGVTNNLRKRVFQHKHADPSTFTSRYKLDRLVYYERFHYIRSAIAREKQIKGWLRIKKMTANEQGRIMSYFAAFNFSICFK